MDNVRLAKELLKIAEEVSPYFTPKEGGVAYVREMSDGTILEEWVTPPEGSDIKRGDVRKVLAGEKNAKDLMAKNSDFIDSDVIVQALGRKFPEDLKPEKRAIITGRPEQLVITIPAEDENGGKADFSVVFQLKKINLPY